MMIVEFRDAAYSRAFELIDEMKDLGKQKKMVLCELEDAIYDCYDSSRNDSEEYDDEYDDEKSDMNLRRGAGYRRSTMRRGYRHDEEDREDDHMLSDMRSNMRRRSGMRRRDGMGRFV